MYVTAWSNGESGYGLKVAKGDRDRFFDPRWRSVVLDLAGEGEIVVRVSPSFWRNCHELRSAEIGRWLHKHGLAPWQRGHPPHVLLQPMGKARFAVRRAGT